MLPAPHPTVICQQLEDGAVLFAPVTEIYFGLNEVGAKVWRLLPPASHTLDDLCLRLASDYPDVNPATIRADVTELLSQLTAEGLVVSPAAGPDGVAAP
jgi:hypothetical protein